MQTVDISSPMIDITSQWFLLTRRNCTNSKLGTPKDMLCLRIGFWSPSTAGNVSLSSALAASICISLNHPVLSSIALSPGDNNGALDACVGT